MTPEDEAHLRQWAEVARDASYYEILGVLELADADAIQDAFHQFALSFHPDVHVTARPAVRRAVTELFRLGVEAYRILSNDALRARYDRALAGGVLRLDTSGGPASATGAVPTLEALGRTPGARYAARKADDLIGEGRLREARDALNEALARDDYDNAALEDRIEALDAAIFVTGG